MPALRFYTFFHEHAQRVGRVIPKSRALREAGASIEPGDRGVTGNAGFGLKFYFTEWLAFRLDVRDYVRQMDRQQLGVDRIVNDIAAMGGLSVFIPFSN